MGMPVIKSSNITRCQSITDIIESVALEQAGIAHILNAEGEKSQKIVEESSSPLEILKVNKSIKGMVTAITKLEMLLQFKLDLFEKCLCDECEPVPTPCVVVTDVNITQDPVQQGVTINETSMVEWNIVNAGEESPSEFIVTPTPDVPIVLKSAPPAGVTLDGNILTIDWEETESGTIILTVGTGDCAIDVTIEYQLT